MTEQTEGAETFRGYIDAEAAATRSFIAYKFGEVSEAEVHRLQRIAHAARERHLAALAAAEARGAQAVLAAVESMELPVRHQPSPALTAARAAAAAAGGA